MKFAAQFMRAPSQYARVTSITLGNHNQAGAQSRRSADRGPFRKRDRRIHLRRMQLVKEAQQGLALGTIMLPEGLEAGILLRPTRFMLKPGHLLVECLFTHQSAAVGAQ